MKDFQLVDHIQMAVAVIDADMTVIDANQAFQNRHHKKSQSVIGSKCFSSAYHFSEGCDRKRSGFCPVRKSFLTKEPASTIHHFWVDDHAVVEELITTPILNDKGDVKYVIEEFRDLSNLLDLKDGIIGICSYCRKIRNKEGEWITIENYLRKHTGANFSHGICEECLEEMSEENESSCSCSD